MGKSSKDKRDAYYRLAKEQNWRARSAFKLIQLDEQFDLFSYADPEKCTRVVDLCAAPGSWSQVLSRVLIKGESLGRRAWVEKMEREREKLQLLEEGLDGLNLRADGDDDDDNKNNSGTALKPRANVKIVAVDLQPMSPLDGITQLKADITHPSTVPLLLSALNPSSSPSPSDNCQTATPQQPDLVKVDLLLSDGAPDVTGLHDLDIYVQSQLLSAALALATQVLRPGGKFVAKIFRARDVDLLYAQLKELFESVHVAKPRASRASSLEAFVVCEGFKPLDELELDHAPQEVRTSDSESQQQQMRRIRRADGIVELHLAERNTSSDLQSQSQSQSQSGSVVDRKRWIAPFLACGDLSAWDADATYKLPPGHVSLPPVQAPTAPPYRNAIERRRAEGGAYGKTKARATANDGT